MISLVLSLSWLARELNVFDSDTMGFEDSAFLGGMLYNRIKERDREGWDVI
jgi:hypothetical protein